MAHFRLGEVEAAQANRRTVQDGKRNAASLIAEPLAFLGKRRLRLALQRRSIDISADIKGSLRTPMNRSTFEVDRKEATMRTLTMTMIAAASAVLTGCVGVESRNPLFPENAKEVVFDPTLLGKWQAVTDDKHVVYEVSRLDDSAYAVPYEDSGGGIARARLLKVRGISLLDACYMSWESQDSGLTRHYFTYHMYAKVRIEPDTLHLAAMSKKWMVGFLATRKLAHYAGAGELVLTAPSAELRKTLLPYLNHRETFGPEEGEFRRLK